MSEVLWTAPVATRPVDAQVSVPGSKSLTARWLLLAALATSPTVLQQPLLSRDTRLMQDALTQLGARFRARDGDLHVDPIPFEDGPGTGSRATREIHAGLAGTVMRFVPAVAALTTDDVRFDGDPGALVRPMGPVIESLRAQQVQITEHGRPGHLPITVHGTGRLAGGTVEIDASGSSQFVSQLLLAGARADEPLVVRHRGEHLPSLPHIAMTLAVLERAGVMADHEITVEGLHQWRVRPGPVELGTVRVEPDLSNAGPFLAAALATGGEVAVDDWPATTTQAGDAYRDLLERMGARVRREDGALCVKGDGTIAGIDADMSAHGELTPTIAALAALAQSASHLRGIRHLRGHETDRVHALATELARVGARTVEHEDSLEIHPGPLHGACFETYEDHRMATAGAIIGLRVPELRIRNIGTTQKTLPDFVGMWLSMLHTDHPEGGAW